MYTCYRLLIGDEWVSSNMEFISPRSERIVGRSPQASARDVDRAVGAAREAFDDKGYWPRPAPAQRAVYLRSFAAAYEPHVDEIAALIAEEMGERDAGERPIRHPDVDKDSFTGSTTTKWCVASLCDGQLKRVSPEQGGESAAVVLDAADIAELVAGPRFASFPNSGQTRRGSDPNPSPQNNYDGEVDAVADLAKSLPIGDPVTPKRTSNPRSPDISKQRVEKFTAVGKTSGRGSSGFRHTLADARQVNSRQGGDCVVSAGS